MPDLQNDTEYTGRIRCTITAVSPRRLAIDRQAVDLLFDALQHIECSVCSPNVCRMGPEYSCVLSSQRHVHMASSSPSFASTKIGYEHGLSCQRIELVVA